MGLVRRTWLVGAVSVCVCASFAAHAASALFEATYLDAAPPSRSPAIVQPAPPPVRKAPIGDLVERNMFCSTCAPLHESGPTSTFHPDAQLIATSIGLVSTATVRASVAQGDFFEGDTIPGVGRIDRIGWTSIDVIDTDGRRGTLSLLGSDAAAGAATPVAASPQVASPWADRIHKVDDATFEVERDLVRELVSGAAKPGMVRVFPITGKNGGLDGLRFSGVRDGTLPASLGLRNGDTLSEINGTHIQSVNTLLDVYAKLDQLNVVELEGTRGGKPLAIQLRLK